MAKVFISSTFEDLREYREAAARGARRAGVTQVLFEDWPAAGDRRPLKRCQDEAWGADVLVVIVAHRYGWIPEEVPGDKSITWLECEAAQGAGREILAFVLADDASWPANRTEAYRRKQARKAGNRDEEAAALRDEGLVDEFRDWLADGRNIKTFTDERSLEDGVKDALQDWLARRDTRKGRDPGAVDTGAKPEIPAAYLAWLRAKCESVELLGLQARDANTARLSQIYVPAVTLATAERGEGRPRGDDSRLVLRTEENAPPRLLERLDRESLYVPGPPGSGKSTFCRWAAWLVCAGALPDHPVPAPEELGEQFPERLRGRLPILVPLREFWPHLPCKPRARTGGARELAQALGHWLTAKAPGGLDEDMLTAHLAAGQVLLILDGLDEVPPAHRSDGHTLYPRAFLISALADARPEWDRAGNRLLLTSRPYGLGAAELKDLGLPEAGLLELPRPLQTLFVQRWFHAVERDRARGLAVAADLARHLDERLELQPLVANPMLLTAVCVMYGEGHRLPEDRFHLYHRLIDNVLYNRYPGDEAERAPVRGRLAAVAHGMHTGEPLGSRRVTPEAEASFAEIERILAVYGEASQATERGTADVVQKREDLLSRSGLLLPRDAGRAAFYHLSFQEFLAAEHIARTTWEEPRLLDLFVQRGAVAEWRPTLVFLFGALALHYRNPQWAVEFLGRLTGSLNRAAVRASPGLATVTAECIDVAVAKGWTLPDTMTEAFRRIALGAVEDEVPLQARMILGLTLGRLGDPRLGDLRDPAWREHGLVEVPAGRYAYQEGYVDIARPFLIGRYPVTNAQFARFMADGGYANRKWWSKPGWQWREEEDATEPAYWRDSRFNTPNQPVVGVSYWEAEAFCRWAGGRLPTEQEWEAAARGPKGHEYPWGDDWEDGICNSSEAGLERTSPVGLFPRARQRELQIEDLSGNVWEWCSDRADFLGGPGRRLRGGSWIDESRYCRAASRFNGRPGLRNGFIGFRLVLGFARQARS